MPNLLKFAIKHSEILCRKSITPHPSFLTMDPKDTIPFNCTKRKVTIKFITIVYIYMYVNYLILVCHISYYNGVRLMIPRCKSLWEKWRHACWRRLHACGPRDIFNISALKLICHMHLGGSIWEVITAKSFLIILFT